MARVPDDKDYIGWILNNARMDRAFMRLSDKQLTISKVYGYKFVIDSSALAEGGCRHDKLRKELTDYVTGTNAPVNNGNNAESMNERLHSAFGYVDLLRSRANAEPYIAERLKEGIMAELARMQFEVSI